MPNPRQTGRGLDGFHFGGVFRDRIAIEPAFAGGAGLVDEIQESAGFLRDHFHAVGARRRRDEKDELDVGAFERGLQRSGLLRREIDDEQAIDAGRGSGLGEAFQTVLEERVVVAEQQDRRFGFLSQAGGQLQGLR